MILLQFTISKNPNVIAQDFKCGRPANLVGWWPSHPAEPIDGVVISDKFQKQRLSEEGKWSLPANSIHPSEQQTEYVPLRVHHNELTEAHILPLIPKLGQIDLEDKKHKKILTSIPRVLAENASVHAAATKALRSTEWDFMAVYYDLIDHFCHATMKFYPPKLPQIPEDFFNYYCQVVEGGYRFQDVMLGRMLDLVDSDTTVIVMSDHGYESGSKRILKMPKYPAAPAWVYDKFPSSGFSC